MSRLPLLALLALPLAGCDHDHGGHGAAPNRVLVMNQTDATLSLVDADAGTVVRTIDLTAQGFAPTAKPHMALVQGNEWIVSLIGADAVVVMDTTGRVLRRATTPSPGMVSMAPDGRYVVSRSLTATNPPASLAFIDPATMAVEERLVGVPHPHALGRSATTVYTASLRAPNLLRIGADGETRGVTVPGGDGQALGHLAISPDGRRLAVSAELTGSVHLYTLATDGTPLYDGTMAVGQRPWHLHFSPDSKTLYVPLFGEDAVAFVDPAARIVRRKVSGYGIAEPYTALVSDDGKWLYVTNANGNNRYTGRRQGAGTLAVIETATGTVARIVEVGRGPTGAALLGSTHVH